MDKRITACHINEGAFNATRELLSAPEQTDNIDGKNGFVVDYYNIKESKHLLRSNAKDKDYTFYQITLDPDSDEVRHYIILSNFVQFTN